MIQGEATIIPAHFRLKLTISLLLSWSHLAQLRKTLSASQAYWAAAQLCTHVGCCQGLAQPFVSCAALAPAPLPRSPSGSPRLLFRRNPPCSNVSASILIFSVICLGYRLEPWKRITGSNARLYEASPTDPRQNSAARFHEGFDNRATQPEVAAEYRCKSESFGAVSAAPNSCPWCSAPANISLPQRGTCIPRSD